MQRFAITERSREEQQHSLTGTRKRSQWVHQVQEKDVVCGCNSVWRCSEAVLGCILDTCTSCCPTSELNREPRNGNRHRWFTGKGLLQVCTNGPGETSTVSGRQQAGHGSNLGCSGDTEAAICRGSWHRVDCQLPGKPAAGTHLSQPPQVNDLRLIKGRCNVTDSKFTLLATWQASESWDRCPGKEYDFIQRAGRPRGWQSRVSKKSSFQGLDASLFYGTEWERRWGSKVKRPLILQSRGGCVHFFFSAARHRWVESDCRPESWAQPL